MVIYRVIQCSRNFTNWLYLCLISYIIWFIRYLPIENIKILECGIKYWWYNILFGNPIIHAFISYFYCFNIALNEVKTFYAPTSFTPFYFLFILKRHFNVVVFQKNMGKTASKYLYLFIIFKSFFWKRASFSTFLATIFSLDLSVKMDVQR